MEQSIEQAWAQARAVFNHGTLRLTGAELRQARDQARPFVRRQANSFIDALGDKVLRQEPRADHVTLQLKGWASELVLRYPRPTRIAERTARHRFDYFSMRLPTGDAQLQLRFTLGEGGRGRDGWDAVEWGLFSWGAQAKIDKGAAPVLRAIRERLPDLQLDSRDDTIGPLGRSVQLGRIMAYTEFGADVRASVETVANDLRRLLDAAREYKDR